jgi:hypothetical protein
MFIPGIPTRIEHAVYGSFPFWDRGYGILTRSGDCRPEWLASLKQACQRLGEPPANSAAAASLFVTRVNRGPWMIVGVFPQGLDDQGRPGALAFHALFVSDFAYRWSGADLFGLGQHLRGQWSAVDLERELAPIAWTARPATNRGKSQASVEPQRSVIATALAHGRRVVVQSDHPINELALSVWSILSPRVRTRTTLATWAFDTANQFQLVAMPKIMRSTVRAGDLLIGPGYADRADERDESFTPVSG